MTMSSTGESAPLVAASAPRVRLVPDAGKDEDQAIECRRVVTLIGSRPGCKIHLKHRSVSALHAAIVNDGANIHVLDLNSDQGTLLNSLKLESERAQDGDLLSIGPWMFRIDVQKEAAGSEAGAPRDLFGVSLDPTPRVVALEHIPTGRILHPRRDVCTLGRRSGCDIVIEDFRVSRVHALLLRYFGHPAVFDVLSHNGTRVNGQEVGFHLLSDGDIIAVGEAQFRVRLIVSSVSLAASGKPDAPPARIPATPRADEVDLADIERAETWKDRHNGDGTMNGS
ncbi:MAG: FHA domain-containing protein [Phycisphaerae bacterium]|nr:FHA domain-containing protein [Phycisphaerae bacterium]